jgi:hypothetical protein
MIASNGKLIVEVDFLQKEKTTISGSDFFLAKEFSTNRRESNPVSCKVIEGNENVALGTILLVHHNRFVEYSPHHLGGNLYSIAYNPSIFAWVDEGGNAHQMCENIIVERVYENNSPLIPDHLKKANKHKYKVVNQGYGFKAGQYVFVFPFADYEIVYNWNGVERRVVKVAKDDIVGVLKN